MIPEAHHPLRGRELTRRVDIRALPKVLLHEHLDGGLRPATVIELAAETRYKSLPNTDSAELAAWFHRGAQRGSLPEYLEGFQHTIAVMQTAEALERVAFEFIEDMFEDGVVYAEVRFPRRSITPMAASPRMRSNATRSRASAVCITAMVCWKPSRYSGRLPRCTRGGTKQRVPRNPCWAGFCNGFPRPIRLPWRDANRRRGARGRALGSARMSTRRVSSLRGADDALQES